MTGLQEVRAAAKLLREQAKAATPGPWHVDEVGDFGDKSATLEIARWRGYTNTVNFGEDRATTDYIATMHPSVGLALADWLDEVTKKIGKPGHREWHGNEAAALTVARAILGDTAVGGPSAESETTAQTPPIPSDFEATDGIRDMIDRGSLGTPEAKALRATVSDEAAARVVARARELEAEVTEGGAS